MSGDDDSEQEKLIAAPCLRELRKKSNMTLKLFIFSLTCSPKMREMGMNLMMKMVKESRNENSLNCDRFLESLLP